MNTKHDDGREIEVFQLQAEVCKSMGDPKRLMIIHELREGEKSVAELAANLGLKQSNTSQHLAVMRKVGVVTANRAGNTVYYSLVTPKIAEACDTVREVITGMLAHSQSLMDVISGGTSGQ